MRYVSTQHTSPLHPAPTLPPLKKEKKKKERKEKQKQKSFTLPQKEKYFFMHLQIIHILMPQK